MLIPSYRVIVEGETFQRILECTTLFFNKTDRDIKGKFITVYSL